MNDNQTSSEANTPVSDHTFVAEDAFSYKSPDTGAVLKTIANPNPCMRMRQSHTIQLPELCPASGNPGKGSFIKICYRGQERLLEVFSLGAYIRAFAGHQVVRDVELLTQNIARDCAAALGQKVTVNGHFELPSIWQSISTRVKARL